MRAMRISISSSIRSNREYCTSDGSRERVTEDGNGARRQRPLDPPRQDAYSSRRGSVALEYPGKRTLDDVFLSIGERGRKQDAVGHVEISVLVGLQRSATFQIAPRRSFLISVSQAIRTGASLRVEQSTSPQAIHY